MTFLRKPHDHEMVPLTEEQFFKQMDELILSRNNGENKSAISKNLLNDNWKTTRKSIEYPEG